MTRPLTHVLLAYLVVSASLPAFAASPSAKDTANGTNIFSTPADDDQVPQYAPAPLGGWQKGQGKQKGLGSSRDGIPNFRQVLTLPTLQPGQRKALNTVFKAYRTQNGDLAAQLKTLKDKRDTAGGALSQFDKQQFLSMRDQMQGLRKQAWEDMKRQLTDQQLRDVEAMRKGELQPATFNGGNNGAMMRQ